MARRKSRFSMPGRLKTFHGRSPRSACSISFACVQSVQTETTSEVNANALAQSGHGLAGEPMGQCIAVASNTSKTFLAPIVHGVFRMTVDKAHL